VLLQLHEDLYVQFDPPEDEEEDDEETESAKARETRRLQDLTRRFKSLYLPNLSSKHQEVELAVELVDVYDLDEDMDQRTVEEEEVDSTESSCTRGRHDYDSDEEDSPSRLHHPHRSSRLASPFLSRTFSKIDDTLCSLLSINTKVQIQMAFDTTVGVETFVQAHRDIVGKYAKEIVDSLMSSSVFSDSWTKTNNTKTKKNSGTEGLVLLQLHEDLYVQFDPPEDEEEDDEETESARDRRVLSSLVVARARESERAEG
jgi:hypothetical protein